MRLPSVFYQIQQSLAQHLPDLRPAQQTGLALWVYGTLLAANACQNAVTTALLGVANFHTVRQRLREWLYDGKDKAAPCGVQVEMDACCTGLVGWLVQLWQEPILFLALDATGHRDCLTVLTLSVLYRGTAVPVWWRVLPGNQPGAWNPHWIAMLRTLRPLLPVSWPVYVFCDRGLWSPSIYQELCALGWHPLMRVRNNMVFTPQGRCRVPARLLLAGAGHAWVGRGHAFTAPKPLPATLIAVWLADQKEPCLVLTDLPADQVGVTWYGLRMWIEAGFRLLKSAGWQWHKTRRTDPTRAARHWLVLAIATLWTLAYGTRVEDTLFPGAWSQEPGAEPSPPARRLVSVFRLGLMALQRQLHRGRLWRRLRLCPQSPPEPSQPLTILYYGPPDTG